MKFKDDAFTKELLYGLVKKFIIDQRIECVEMIYDTDRVIENSYDFIGTLYETIVDEDA